MNSTEFADHTIRRHASDLVDAEAEAIAKATGATRDDGGQRPVESLLHQIEWGLIGDLAAAEVQQRAAAAYVRGVDEGRDPAEVAAGVLSFMRRGADQFLLYGSNSSSAATNQIAEARARAQHRLAAGETALGASFGEIAKGGESA